MAYLPSDLLTTNEDGHQVTGDRRLKVESEVIGLAQQLAISTLEANCTSAAILKELKLLSAMFEEALNTGINRSDIE